jgi:6-methylsalicylate decarboxylase
VPTYDLHQHLWPEPFVAALRARRQPPFLSGGELATVEGRLAVELGAHDPEQRVRQLDRDGIDVAVLSLQTSLGLERLAESERGELEETWAEGMRSLVGASGGRFAAFSPSRPRDGFAGVSLSAGDLLGLAASAPALDTAAERGLVVFVHPDASAPAGNHRPAWWEWVTGYPARMQAAYLSWLTAGRTRWPTLPVVFAMLAGGGPFQLERLALQGVDVRSTLDPATFLDVSSYGRRAIELCIETFGVGQLVYGSDVPVVDPRPTLRAVRGFGDAVAHKVQAETPARLLP